MVLYSCVSWELAIALLGEKKMAGNGCKKIDVVIFDGEKFADFLPTHFFHLRVRACGCVPEGGGPTKGKMNLSRKEELRKTNSQRR